MKDLYLVAHTHWDREWYKPFQSFRVRLVYMVDRLVDLLESDSTFTSFMLDGQTIVLDDYLKIRPERKERLQGLIRAGRIKVGPWYIQPDEFAPDAESLIRNLQIGITAAHDFGGSMMVGYLPDSFGQSAQMPQILKGFGIDSLVAMRGIDFDAIESTEFIWRGLNGEKILGVYLLKGYSNAMFLSGNPDIDIARLNELESEIAPYTKADSILVMNGVDHAFAQATSADFCNGETSRRLGTLEGWLDDFRRLDGELPVLSGDLLTPRNHRVHSSIASTRINQKAENRRLSILLERVLEPLCSASSLLGSEYPRGLILEAWKALISNQTHDGICGCCTDEVHREMDQRFTEVHQLADRLIKSHSRAIAYAINSKEPGIAVFNTPMRAGKRFVEAEVFSSEPFKLMDDAGQEMNYQLISTEEVDLSKYSIWTLYMLEPHHTMKYRILFECDFTSNYGYKFFRLVKCGNKAHSSVARSDTAGFENLFYKMDIKSDGSITVFDKDTGICFEGLNVYEDTGEGGDTYNHSPITNDKRLLSTNFKATVKLAESGDLYNTYIISQTMKIPASLSEDGRSRREECVDMPIQTRLRVWSGSRRIDFSVKIENNALSHRIRALFPFGRGVESAFAETQFGVIERDVRAQSPGEGWAEIPLPIYSMQRFTALRTHQCALAVLNRGLTEYEVYSPHDAVLAITLHRGVSMMGRPDLAIRPGRASGIEVPTPDAESPGTLTREYSMMLSGALSNAELSAQADFYCSPSLAAQNYLDFGSLSDKEKAFINNISIATMTSVINDDMKSKPLTTWDFFSLENPLLAVSALKASAFAGNSIILRLYNPEAFPVDGGLIDIFTQHKRVVVTDLLEKEESELFRNTEKKWVLPKIPGFTQLTLKIEL